MSGIFDQVINYSPSSLLLGTVTYKGTWSAATNTPTLVNPTDSTTNGHYYVVSAGGTQFSLVFNIGDWIISNGSAWEKVDNTDAVSSVFGRTGAVVGVSTDYSSVGINSTAIGATTPSTGAFTTLTASGNLTTTGGTAHVIEMGAGSFTLSRTGIASTVTDFASGRLNVTTTGGVLNLRDNATDATNKILKIGNSHYTNAEEPLGVIFSQSTNTAGAVYIGGGTATFNAATEIGLYAAADNTTVTGTQVANFTTTKLGVLQTTASTSTTTGALVVTGGLGVAGAFYGTAFNLTKPSYTAAAGTTEQNTISSTVVGDAGGTTISRTLRVGADNSGTNNINTVNAARINANAGGSGGTVAILNPLLVSANHSGANAVTTMSLLQLQPQSTNASAANITTLTYVSTSNLFPTSGDVVGAITGISMGDIGRATSTTNTVFYAFNQTKGSGDAIAYRGGMMAASGKYNLYMDGTAQNYLLGKTGIGQTPSATDTLAVTGTTLLTGNTAITGTLSATGALAIGNTVNTVSPTSPNRTVTIVIGGTTYYLAAKTTND